MSLFRAVLLRTVSVAVLAVSIGYVAVAGSAGGSAALGAGIVAFAVLVVAGLVWGLIDGVRTGRFRRSAVMWLLVAVLVGTVAGVQMVASSSHVDPAVVASDVAGVIALVAGLMGVPALVGVMIGAGMARSRLGRASGHMRSGS